MDSLSPPDDLVLQRLQGVGLRPTRQRVAMAALLFGDRQCRHVTAEQLHVQAQAASLDISLATIYNTLHQFTTVGLLREVVVEAGRCYFDTNTTEHHHFYFETTGQLLDIPASSLSVNAVPVAPEGMRVTRVDVIVRLA